MIGSDSYVDRIRREKTSVPVRVAFFFAFSHLLAAAAAIGFVMVRSALLHGTFQTLPLQWASTHGHSLIFGWLGMASVALTYRVLPQAKGVGFTKSDRAAIAISCMGFGSVVHLLCLPLSAWVSPFVVLHVRMTAGLLQVAGYGIFCWDLWGFVRGIPEERVARFEKMVLLGGIWFLVGLLTEVLLWLFSEASAIAIGLEPQSFFVLRHLELEGGLLLMFLGLVQPIYRYPPPEAEADWWVPPISQWTMWGIILAVFALNVTSVGPDEAEAWVSTLAPVLSLGPQTAKSAAESINRSIPFCIPLAIGLEALALGTYFAGLLRIRRIGREVKVTVPSPFSGPRLLINAWLIAAHGGFFILAMGVFFHGGTLSRLGSAMLTHLFGVGFFTTLALYLMRLYRAPAFERIPWLFQALWGTAQLGLVLFLVSLSVSRLSTQMGPGSGFATGCAFAGAGALALCLAVFAVWGMALTVLGSDSMRNTDI
jgi:hypothetical protein